MKRFLLFCHDCYYPCGGWSDYEGSFDTAEEAMAFKTRYQSDNGEVVDSTTEQVVYEGTRNGWTSDAPMNWLPVAGASESKP